MSHFLRENTNKCEKIPEPSRAGKGLEQILERQEAAKRSQELPTPVARPSPVIPTFVQSGPVRIPIFEHHAKDVNVGGSGSRAAEKPSPVDPTSAQSDPVRKPVLQRQSSYVRIRPSASSGVAGSAPPVIPTFTESGPVGNPVFERHGKGVNVSPTPVRPTSKTHRSLLSTSSGDEDPYSFDKRPSRNVSRRWSYKQDREPGEIQEGPGHIEVPDYHALRHELESASQERVALRNSLANAAMTNEQLAEQLTNFSKENTYLKTLNAEYQSAAEANARIINPQNIHDAMNAHDMTLNNLMPYQDHLPVDYHGYMSLGGYASTMAHLSDMLARERQRELHYSRRLQDLGQALEHLQMTIRECRHENTSLKRILTEMGRLV